MNMSSEQTNAPTHPKEDLREELPPQRIRNRTSHLLNYLIKHELVVPKEMAAQEATEETEEEYNARALELRRKYPCPGRELTVDQVTY